MIAIIIGFIALCAIVFLSNAVPALIHVKLNKEETEFYFNKYILIITGVCTFVMIAWFVLANIFLYDQNEYINYYKDSVENNSKYELIKEPLYRQIK